MAVVVNLNIGPFFLIDLLCFNILIVCVGLLAYKHEVAETATSLNKLLLECDVGVYTIPCYINLNDIAH